MLLKDLSNFYDYFIFWSDWKSLQPLAFAQCALNGDDFFIFLSIWMDPDVRKQALRFIFSIVLTFRDRISNKPHISSYFHSSLRYNVRGVIWIHTSFAVTLLYVCSSTIFPNFYCSWVLFLSISTDVLQRGLLSFFSPPPQSCKSAVSLFIWY